MRKESIASVLPLKTFSTMITYSWSQWKNTCYLNGNKSMTFKNIWNNDITSPSLCCLLSISVTCDEMDVYSLYNYRNSWCVCYFRDTFRNWHIQRINRPDGCGEEDQLGWMLVKEPRNNGSCTWDTSTVKKPYFLYNTGIAATSPGMLD